MRLILTEIMTSTLAPRAQPGIYAYCPTRRQELQALVEAEVRDIDLWHVSFSSATAKFDEEEKPHALSISSGSDAQGDALGRADAAKTMHGMFVYYFSFGLDAEVAYRCCLSPASLRLLLCALRSLK